MDDFFSKFARFGFQHQPDSAPQHEFARLQASRGWKEGSSAYKRNRKAFLAALTAQSHSHVHKFFVETHRFSSYDPTANPKAEFERLARERRWKPTKKSYKDAKEAFNKAFQFEFGADVLDFFEEHEGGGFEYNARGGAIEQLYLLAEQRDWGWNSKEWRDARDSFYDAIARDFNATFGKDDSDLSGWRHLCKVLGVDGSHAVTADECRSVGILFRCSI
jgi:hypothetical protein